MYFFGIACGLTFCALENLSAKRKDKRCLVVRGSAAKDSVSHRSLRLFLEWGNVSEYSLIIRESPLRPTSSVMRFPLQECLRWRLARPALEPHQFDETYE